MTFESITIATDQNRLYRCSFDVPDRCWYRVTDADTMETSRYCEENPHPLHSKDTQKARLICDLHEAHTEMYVVRLDKRGRVETWAMDLPGFHPLYNPILALLGRAFLLLPAAVLGLLADLFVNRR